MASWLLRLLGPDVHGGAEEGLGLTFDMNRLFQEAVSVALGAAIRRHARHQQLRLTREQPVRALVKDASETGRFMLRPDLCLWLEDQLIAILDTKWKRLSPVHDQHKADISQADLYQLLAYGHAYGCDRLVLIYPHHPGLQDWSLPRFRYCSSTPSDIALQVAAFDLQASRCAADQLLEQQFDGLG